jgi:hypothetical protein
VKKDSLALEPDVYALLTTTPNASTKSINHKRLADTVVAGAIKLHIRVDQSL